MLAKWWKKICLLILIIACIYNVMNKLVNRLSFGEQIDTTVTYYNVVLNETTTNTSNEANTTNTNDVTNTNTNSNVSIYN